MPTTAQLRDKLIEKLQELFQLDQPELDFGFYRIMHAKAEQVQRFLENDLLAEVQQAFADGTSAKQAELKQAYEEALAQAKKFGVPDPENSAPVQEAKGRWTDALDTTKAEAEVYDHLYRFFERYYEDGDFVSRRYLTRETAGKAAPYAVPYDGQEVMLHWANRDQYYIKTSEHFDHYTFELREAARQLRQAAKASTDQEALDLDEGLLEGEPLRVHFRIVTAAEGEHNNVKESADKKRYFIVDGAQPIAFNAAGELECRFTYRPDPEKTGQENTWKQTRNSRNEAALLETITALAKTDKRAAAYLPLLKLNAARGKKKDERSLLGKYIEKYTATNSKDYFIHKNLGGFLRRELDFYLKNEVMRLDDLEGAEAPRVEQYLAKLKVIRRIAHKLTDFLAQLENFQKRLWLKKKFVVETNYCITLDRVPEALYPAIAANAAQKTEWEKLFAIEDLPGYEAKKPLTVDFLKANPYLVLDTAFLSESEKAALLNALDDLDAQCNGLLVHSENFQALRMLEGRYREQVKCVYIDPPYNTKSRDFNYKDGFRHSSWLAMMHDRYTASRPLQSSDGLLFTHIDEHEHGNLTALLDDMFPEDARPGDIVWKNSSKNDEDYVSMQHEYIVSAVIDSNQNKGEWKERKEGLEDIYKAFAGFRRKHGTNWKAIHEAALKWYNTFPESNPIRDSKHYSWMDERGVYFPDNISGPNFGQYVYDVHHPETEKVCKPPASGWRFPEATMLERIEAGLVHFGDDETTVPNNKTYLSNTEFQSLTSIKYRDGRVASKLLKGMFGKEVFKNPKDPELTGRMLKATTEEGSTVADFFAGSATTGHAILELQRNGAGMRAYVLVEMGDHFDGVTKPRMQKVMHSRSWRDGKPVDRDGISHCFKYIRLESYEDTLNALELRSDAERENLLAANKPLREDYTLRYLLDVETRDSTSLLNHTAFTDPRAYTLHVKRPGSEERTTKTVDLLETFNYLLGLRVQHIAAPETFTAAFERVQEPDVPKDQPQRLVVKGNLKPVQEPVTPSGAEAYWFRRVQGWMPRDRHKPHGEKDKVLIIWRTLSADREQDNAVLDTYFTKNRLEIRDKEFDVIYVNGSNNLPNLLQAGERWKVRLIEEDFHRLMWEGAE